MGGIFQGQKPIPSGSVGHPGLPYADAPFTGLYLANGGSVGLTSGGKMVFIAGSDNINIGENVHPDFPVGSHANVCLGAGAADYLILNYGFPSNRFSLTTMADANPLIEGYQDQVEANSTLHFNAACTFGSGTTLPSVFPSASMIIGEAGLRLDAGVNGLTEYMIQNSRVYYQEAGANIVSHGVVALVGGQAVVNADQLNANTRIFLSVQQGGTYTGRVRVSAKTPTTFTINTGVVTDNCVVAWEVKEAL
jgi:hypothetical protein